MATIDSMLLSDKTDVLATKKDIAILRADIAISKADLSDQYNKKFQALLIWQFAFMLTQWGVIFALFKLLVK
jgi:hypothetical protein